MLNKIINFFRRKKKFDIQDTTALTINELREAFKNQKHLEAEHYNGSRYQEILKIHVPNPDFKK